MRVITAAVTLIAALTLHIPASYASEAESTYIRMPPSTLKQWYKPQHKRQAWLHTMFRLRREMQAIGEYAAYQDSERLRAWVDKFSRDYLSIGKMVPEWNDELEIEAVSALERAAADSQFEQVDKALQKIGRSCSGCHKEFRAVSAALYRGADFSTIRVEDSETMEEMTYKDAMAGLSTAMNRIKIASVDERFDIATSAYQLLGKRMGDVATSCHACHSTDKQKNYLFDETVKNDMQQLGELIERKDSKQTQRTLGSVAVNVCAKCHSIHRTLSDLTGFIKK